MLFQRLPAQKAAIWSLLGAYMLLPSSLEVDAPLLPPLDKMSITAVTTLMLCWAFGSTIPRAPLPSIIPVLACIFVVSPLLTSFDNSYELEIAGNSIPGFYPLVALKFAGRNLLSLIPLYIGCRFLANSDGRMALLKAVPTAMLFYSLPMMFEIRMSPQLHRWIYGYFPHASFAQQIRDGGFRPVVFFPHGLTLALFTSLTLLATLLLFRLKTRIFSVSPSLLSSYFAGLLLLCKSLGPIIYAVVFAPLILFTRPRFWVRIGCAVSIVACAYPFLRTNGLSPVDLVTIAAREVSPKRSASFEVRVRNENELLAKANEKPLFGWGGWGRSRIYDEATGTDISVTDGAWIIEYGTFGWTGYLSLFGLLAAALFSAARRTTNELSAGNIARGGLALLLAVHIIDSIPNATDMSLVFLIAGCIATKSQLSRGFTRKRRLEGNGFQGHRRESPHLTASDEWKEGPGHEAR